MSDDPRKAAEKIAIACAIKSTEITKLKRDLPRGQSINVDVVARIKGVVQIGVDGPGGSGERDPIVSMRNGDVISEVLRRLKVTPAELRKTLRAIARAGHDAAYQDNAPNAELLGVFEQVERDVAKKLPPVPYTTAGRAASVAVNAEVRIIDPPSAVKRAA